MQSVEKTYSGIIDDEERVWNFDETPVDATKSRDQKAYNSSSSHHGGVLGSKTTKSMEKHVTAVIVVFRSGRKVPLFYLQRQAMYVKLVQSTSVYCQFKLNFLSSHTFYVGSLVFGF